jgi:DNA polymerase III epsilon subunit-like protein
VREKPAIHQVLPEFLAFCGNDIVIAHNAPFDLRFINAEAARIGLPPFRPRVYDTCVLARERMRGCPNFRLETLKAALGFGRGQAHRALADARDCMQIFIHCLRQETPRLHLPIQPPPLPETLSPLREALTSGGTVTIEYRDIRGQITCREIRPLHIDTTSVEAYCLLRNDKRHFALERIKRAWRG